MKTLLLGSILIMAFGGASLIHAQSKERAPKLPDNLARFDNEYPMFLFENAAVKKRLRVLLGKSYDGFMEAIDTQSPMERSGDLLIGKGCAKGLCQIYEAMIVIDLAAKTIHCGIVGVALNPKYRKFSESPKEFPAIITDWANDLLEKDKGNAAGKVRVEFSRGKTSKIITGRIKTFLEAPTYLVNVGGNQKFSVRVLSASGDFEIYLNTPDNQDIPMLTERKKSWSGTITEMGDCEITINPKKANFRYTLEIFVVNGEL